MTRPAFSSPLLSVTPQDVEAAYGRIATQIRQTPLERSSFLSALVGREVFLKLEALQRTGSFKLRGGLNAVAMLDGRGHGGAIVTASAGNHGLGIAAAARLHRRPARVFVPAGAPLVKRERLRAQGAEVFLVDGGYDDAHAEAVRYAEERQLPYIHAYSDPDVVAGQGTVALEIFRQLPETETIVVPVGGGGLIGGTGIVGRSMTRAPRVVGVQSDATAAMYLSLEAGTLQSVPHVPTRCDGLAGDVDAHTLALARRMIDEMVLVREESVAQAIQRLYLEEGVIAEGAAAVGVAALLEGKIFGDGPIVVIVTGSNIDASKLATLLE